MKKEITLADMLPGGALHKRLLEPFRLLVQDQLQPQETPVEKPADPTPQLPASATANARMIDTMKKNPKSKDWSIRQWMVHLGCKSPSAVQKTAAWKQIMATRLAEQVARVVEDQTGKRKRKR